MYHQTIALTQKIQKLGFDVFGLGGSLSDLATVDKSSIVSAVNEVKNQSTVTATSLSNAITASGGIYNSDGTYNGTIVDGALTHVTSSTDLLNALDQLDDSITNVETNLSSLTLTDLSDVNIARATEDLLFVFDFNQATWKEVPFSFSDLDYVIEGATHAIRLKDGSVKFNKIDPAVLDTSSLSGSSTLIPVSSVVKEYVDQKVLTGGTVKEAILSDIQFLTDHPDSDGIRPATLLNVDVDSWVNDGNTGSVIVDGDAITISGEMYSSTKTAPVTGSVTFTFRNTPVNDTDVQIGSDDSETLANFVSVLDTYRASNDWVALGKIVDYPEFWYLKNRSVVLAGAIAKDGAYSLSGTFTNATYVKVIDFSQLKHYVASVDDIIQIPATDTNVFGFGRYESDCSDGEIHYVLVEDILYALDKGGDANYTWNILSGVSSIPDATSASGGGIKGKVTFDSNYGLVVIGGVARAKVANGLTFDVNGNISIADATGVGISISSGQFSVLYDDVTIGLSSNQLYVKDGSITAAKLGSDVTGAAIPSGYSSPSNYTPAEVSNEGIDKISAHLKGIDNALSGVSTNTNYEIGILNGKETYYKENTYGTNNELDKSVIWKDDVKNKLRLVVEYTYDANSNITSVLQKFYKEDGADEASATLDKSMTTDFTYDSFGNIISENHHVTV